MPPKGVSKKVFEENIILDGLPGQTTVKIMTKTLTFGN